ncbi:MAG: hypothetical protein IH600_15710 [Bacteroidetes bacterium]|nr:hypothetical protein [Bacteroidota bacterium]
MIRGSKILHQYQPDNKTHTGSASYVGFHLENGADYRRATYQGILTLEDGILCKELLLPDEPCSCIVKKFRINGSMNVGVDGGDLVIENSVIDTLIITANGKSLNLTIRNCKVSNLLQIKNAYVGKLKLENVDAAGRIELGSRLNIGSLLLLNVSAASEEAKLVLRYLKISDELRVKGDDLRLNLMCDSAYFASGIDFSGAVFTHSLDLLRASSGGKINLFSTEIANEMMVDERSFRDGLDFSDAIVTGHVKIRLASDYKKYMVGFSWDDYENDFISFQFSDPSLREQNYSKVYRVLRRLLQEHTAIGDDETVLQIAFEIKRFKTEFVGNDADKFMGWLFGFGGVPWTFFWVVSGIIAVCSLLYALVCSDIHGILFDEIVDLPHFRNAIVMVYFSASVFMSLRFKREWLKVSSHLLSVIMVLEYAVGLVLIVLFVVYVANSIPQFEFVKQWLI